MNKVSAEVEKEVLERFLSGQTNISKLAKEFSLNYRTVCRIVQKDAELYRQTIKQARREATERRKQHWRKTAEKCMKKKRTDCKEKEAEISEQQIRIYEYFWAVKCTEDDYGLCSEYDVAKHFGITVAEVIQALRCFSDYRELETYREHVIAKKMEELQRETAFSMSKHPKLDKIQAVMLNTSAYRYDPQKKALVYRAAAAKPKDLPSRLSAIVYSENLEENVVKEKTETEKWVSETEQQVLTSEEISSKKKKGKKKKHKKNKKHEKKPEPPIDKK